MFVLKRAFPGSPLHSGQCQVRVHNTTKPLGMPWGVTPRPRQDRAVRKALFQNTELTTKALEQGGRQTLGRAGQWGWPGCCGQTDPAAGSGGVWRSRAVGLGAPTLGPPAGAGGGAGGG